MALAVEVVAADNDDREDGVGCLWRNVGVVLVFVVLVEHDDIRVHGFHCVSTGTKPETTTTANEDDRNRRLHQGDQLAKALISWAFDDATRLLAI